MMLTETTNLSRTLNHELDQPVCVGMQIKTSMDRYYRTHLHLSTDSPANTKAPSSDLATCFVAVLPLELQLDQVTGLDWYFAVGIGCCTMQCCCCGGHWFVAES